uniref:Ankyrin repeat and SOCS box containing 5 n=1 Tax=Anolis carolinensis TaxID=28377 RepID=A0A803SUK0_ANOCA
ITPIWLKSDLCSWADRSPLHEAASQGRLLSLKTLIAQGYNVDALTIDQVTPLHEACLGDHVGCARLLLEAGANVSIISSCTSYAELWPGSTSSFLVLGHCRHLCRCRKGTCANVQKGKFLETPLHAAARQSNPEIISMLLDFGADINAKNTEFERPIDVASPSTLVERVLLLHEATPCSLCQLCRLRIRNYIGRARLHLVPQLQLPTILKDFLQYR